MRMHTDELEVIDYNDAQRTDSDSPCTHGVAVDCVVAVFCKDFDANGMKLCNEADQRELDNH